MSRDRDDLAAELAARYDREALDYRELWAPVLLTAGAALVRTLADPRARLVLDVGAGVGTLAPELRRAFPAAAVIGLDRSPGMLALGPPAVPRAVMDAAALAVRAACADLVLLAFMLFHLREPAEGLAEARRVLRPGGRVATLTWAGDLESAATRIWTECLDAHGAPPADPAPAARHERVDSPAKLEALLGAAGFAAARAWEAELVHVLGADHLVRLRTRMGAGRPRFDGLAPAARAACVAEARGRMAALGPADFEARGRIVAAVAIR